ncbi:hypothetical protein CTI12_AA277210 [Artemisia annua]|uniref:Uncharacterized protein n=1 Tax=Artemisia annua TaxID=35608 RepID=A0A2U1NE30_ARTAN|nr:hypothetical protein CTI12_AA277210 [Artemisia annua]
MGLEFRSLTVRVICICLLLFWMNVGAQKTLDEENDNVTYVRRDLDAILQDYAYRAFGSRPRTGVVYNGVPPLDLPGIQISAMRLRSGSLFKRGVKNYKEFVIPIGVLEERYVERLVLVYQNLGNWSSKYYPLSGYEYRAPVLGLLAYNAFDLSAKNLPLLEIRASGEPISIEFAHVDKVPDDLVAKCVSFDLNGVMNLTNVTSGNTCVTGWIIVGSVAGGIALLVLLALCILWLWRLNKRKKMHRMEKAADAGEALHMTTVGNTKAPAATTTRTQPTLETEYIP